MRTRIQKVLLKLRSAWKDDQRSHRPVFWMAGEMLMDNERNQNYSNSNFVSIVSIKGNIFHIGKVWTSDKNGWRPEM